MLEGAIIIVSVLRTKHFSVIEEMRDVLFWETRQEKQESFEETCQILQELILT